MTDRGRQINEFAVATIKRIAPSGLGRWDPAWTLVAEPSDRYLDDLRAWEDEDTPQNRADLQASAEALVHAWREAARLYTARHATEVRAGA